MNEEGGGLLSSATESVTNTTKNRDHGASFCPKVKEEEPSKVFCAELSPLTLLCLQSAPLSQTVLLPSGWSVVEGLTRKYAKPAISVELNGDGLDKENSNKGRERIRFTTKVLLIAQSQIGGL